MWELCRGRWREIGRKCHAPGFFLLYKCRAVKILVEAWGSRILSSFPPDLSANAQGALESMGVTVLIRRYVTFARMVWRWTGTSSVTP